MITYFGVGPKQGTFPRLPANDNHSWSGRITALALAADQARLYAGSWAGVWRSDDAGESWSQLTWAQPSPGVVDADVPGALYPPHVVDIATSPADPDVVLVSGLDSQFNDGRDGIYRSGDGGSSWTLVMKSTTPFNVVFAPDDPQLVYAAGVQSSWYGSSGVVAVSRDAGQTWRTRAVGSSLWHLAVGPLEPDGSRRIYAVGNSVVWYSNDGGQTWRSDGGVATINAIRQQLADFFRTCDPNAGLGGFGGGAAYAGGDAPQILAIEPGNPSVVYLVTAGGANGPAYYATVPDGTPVNSDCRRLAGEASLWRGDFSQFDASGGAEWTLVPGPPLYSGATTPSGNRYVSAKATSSGFLLFFSDNSHVHVSAGVPTDFAAWHRLDGMDASVARRSGIHSNVVFMHVDPHAVAFTSDFEITLKPPTGVQDPYDKNSELDTHVAGRLWMANDGGVYWCDDGGRDETSWQMPAGLETLDPVNVSGLYGIGDSPALYFGCGDNNDFFSRDGGASWGDPQSGCGDCDAWFADLAQPSRVYQFLPRRAGGQIGIVKSDGSEYPNAGDDGSKTFVPSPKKRSWGDPSKLAPYAASDVYLFGYRPLIQTLPSELPQADGDVVIIEQALDGTAILLRTTRISSIQSIDDWHDPGKAQQVGPALPMGAIVVQAGGGHADPAYYVADRAGQIWKLSADQTTWNRIVPNTPLGSATVYSALQWFVDPYESEGVYVLDAQGAKLSLDGGATWIFDVGMTNALTGGGKLAISPSIMQNMHFSRDERETRFAVGTGGVIGTTDFGLTWFSVVNSVALPGRPESAFFDPVSDPADRALYVDCEGRSVLRVGGLPQPLFEPGEPLDMLEVAALDY